MAGRETLKLLDALKDAAGAMAAKEMPEPPLILKGKELEHAIKSFRDTGKPELPDWMPEDYFMYYVGRASLMMRAIEEDKALASAGVPFASGA